MKIYTNFSDKHGNAYGFSNYPDFARFWFSLSRKTAISQFPDKFKKLQFAAAQSKEAKTKVSNQI